MCDNAGGFVRLTENSSTVYSTTALSREHLVRVEDIESIFSNGVGTAVVVLKRREGVAGDTLRLYVAGAVDDIVKQLQWPIRAACNCMHQWTWWNAATPNNGSNAAPYYYGNTYI